MAHLSSSLFLLRPASPLCQSSFKYPRVWFIYQAVYSSFGLLSPSVNPASSTQGYVSFIKLFIPPSTCFPLCQSSIKYQRVWLIYQAVYSSFNPLPASVNPASGTQGYDSFIKLFIPPLAIFPLCQSCINYPRVWLIYQAVYSSFNLCFPLLSILHHIPKVLFIYRAIYSSFDLFPLCLSYIKLSCLFLCPFCQSCVK